MEPEIYTPDPEFVLARVRYPHKEYGPARAYCSSIQVDDAGLLIRLDDHQASEMWMEIRIPPDMLHGLAMLAENNRRLAQQYQAPKTAG